MVSSLRGSIARDSTSIKPGVFLVGSADHVSPASSDLNMPEIVPASSKFGLIVHEGVLWTKERSRAAKELTV